MDKFRLLIVEDDQDLSTQMKWGLSEEYDILQAGDRQTALEIFKTKQPLVATLDLGLPPDADGVTEGLRALSTILEHDPLAKVIIISGRDEKENALAAIGLGAYDFMSKPVQLEELQVILHRAFHVAQLEREHRSLLKQVHYEPLGGMLGTSPQIESVAAMIRKVANSEASVLIVGESGTGKEVAARAIHDLSPRRDGPFVAINCGAIPPTLLESELFGHEKGAFTGAHTQRSGLIEKAKGGTLFLDEIAEISPLLQVKLLRFLQEQRIERVGGREEIFVDARVLAATNVEMAQALKDGRFREDLYYRLGVVTVSIPPLREREGDIPLLAKAFLQRFSKESNKVLKGFSPQALRALELHNWPGNIRELINRVKRAIIMTDDAKISPADLELSSKYAKYEGQGLKQAREALERDMIQRALIKNKGNMTRTAAELEISRPTLYELIDRLGVESK